MHNTKKIVSGSKKAVLSLLLLTPFISFAQFNAETTELRENFFLPILAFINGVLIPFIIGIGFLFFVWGMFQYFIAGGANDESKEKGRSLMVYATLGFVFIIIFWGVVNLIATSTGETSDVAPTVPNTVTPTGGDIVGEPVVPGG